MANISAEVIEDRIREFGKPWMLDDLIRLRAEDEVQVPIVGYPRYKDKAVDYELFTGKDLDRMVDETCRVLMAAGLEMNSHKIIGLFAPSDLSYVVTLFALSRLGCRLLAMSIRLSEVACLNLMEKTGCDTLLVGSTVRINNTINGLKGVRSDLRFLPMPTRSQFDKPEGPAVRRPIPDREAEHVQPAFYGHSSGSTGLPKPLTLSHRSVLNNVYFGTGCKAFNALPWYHLHGIFTSFQAIYMRKTAHLYNAHLPLTAEHLVAALKEIQPEICHTVPYVLKLMAERQDGIDVLKRCKFVTAAGARTPDELGDRVVQQGVNFGVILGLTEVGHMGESIYREPGDDSWVYIRPYASLRSHMYFDKIGEGVYEAVYLKSHPALMPSTSNSDDGSFRSKDLFTPHPTMANAWKYIARDDDRLTLLSGEKILPVGMEGTVRESPLVRDGLMVGNDRLVPGLLLFRSTAAAPLSDAAFLDAVWPLIEAANTIMDEHGRIARDMVVALPADVEYPATDKNNIIRAASYRQFEDVIEALYREDNSNGVTVGVSSGTHTNGVVVPATAENQQRQKQPLSLQDLETFIFHLVRDRAGVAVPDYETDFFAAGVDSLRAAQLRRLLLQELDLGGRTLTTNVVYDAGNVRKLAAALYAMQTGVAEPEQLLLLPEKGGLTDDEREMAKMEELISEYGADFLDYEKPRPEGKFVVLTGATGALGAHILNQLLDDPKVTRVYCLVRGGDAYERVSRSLDERGLSLAGSNHNNSNGNDNGNGNNHSNGTNGSVTTNITERAEKLTVFTTHDFGLPHLGLRRAEYAELRRHATLIIHAAWPVNFNIALESFRPQIAGLRNLLDLAAETTSDSSSSSSSSITRFIFISSISTAFGLPRPARVPETSLSPLSSAAATGYARSKLIGERICEAAGTNKKVAVRVLRVGQIAADSVHGIWNEKEHVPMLVRSAAEIGALPRLLHERRCAWMPADTVAETVLQIAAGAPSTTGNSGTEFYNITPPHDFDWNDVFLPALREAGLRFEEVTLAEWLSRLRARADALGPLAEERLPAFKLAGYYEATFGSGGEGEGEGEGNGKGKAEAEAGYGSSDLEFVNDRACASSFALCYCLKLSEVGIVRKMLKHWFRHDSHLLNGDKQ